MPQPDEDEDDPGDVGSELDLEQHMEVEKRDSLSLDFKELLEDEGEDDEPPPPGARRRAGAPAPTAKVGGGSLEADSFLTRGERAAMAKAQQNMEANPDVSRLETRLPGADAGVVRTDSRPWMKLLLFGVLFLLVVGGTVFGGLQLMASRRQAELDQLQQAQEMIRAAEEDRLRRLNERSGRGAALPAAAAPAAPADSPAAAPSP